MSCATLPIRSVASSYRAVALRQIFGAAHLLEAAGGALKFEAAIARRIESLRLGVRGCEELHLMLVERIDQGDEARSLVAQFGTHHRNPDDDHRVIAARDGQIIGRAARLAAQALEREDGNALEAFRDMKLASAADVDVFGRHLRAIFDRIFGELEKGA